METAFLESVNKNKENRNISLNSYYSDAFNCFWVVPGGLVTSLFKPLPWKLSFYKLVLYQLRSVTLKERRQIFMKPLTLYNKSTDW